MEITRVIYVDKKRSGTFKLMKIKNLYWWRYSPGPSTQELYLENRKCLSVKDFGEQSVETCTLIEFKEEDLL